MPTGATARVAGFVYDAADFFQSLKVLGVLAQRIFDLGLFEHRVDAAQPVRLRVGQPVEPVKRVLEKF